MTEKELYQRLRDPEDYCGRWLRIRTKEGKMLPLKFNPTQKKVYDHIQKCKNEKKPVRLIILKARQQGISTMTEGLVFHDSATRANMRSLIVAHDPDSTDHLFDMCKIFYDNLPSWLAPAIHRSNKKNLVFEQFNAVTKKVDGGLKSRIDVVTASKKEPRSKTLSNFHGSEVAFWPDADKLMLAAAQMVPDHWDTMVILESTANGVGDYFYNAFWDAQNGKSDYTAIFLGWHEFPEYSRPTNKDFQLTDAEKALKTRFELTDDQINWRRYTIRNKCGGDINKFKQEYPMTA